MCVSQRVWLYSVTEWNANDFGVFDVEMIDWTLAFCTRCV